MKKTSRKWHYVIIIGFMMGIWLTDVSVTCLNIGCKLSNGLVILEPAVGYHIGLSFIIMMFAAILMVNDYES